MRVCAKKCHKGLLGCPHVCQAQCHEGACPETCQEEVPVRCACRRQKAKWKCSEVMQELEARGQKYDASVVPRLLACNADCASHKVCLPSTPH